MIFDGYALSDTTYYMYMISLGHGSWANDFICSLVSVYDAADHIRHSLGAHTPSNNVYHVLGAFDAGDIIYKCIYFLQMAVIYICNLV